MAEKRTDVIYAERVSKALDAEPNGDGLWLTASVMESATGWQLKPQGFCKGDVCVPVPPSRRNDFVAGSRYNLAALAELIGQPVIRDQEHRVWCFGEASAERRRALTSLNAPDFELPDLSGKLHRLSDHRGKKVLLASWASW
jgi:hypothetical protein